MTEVMRMNCLIHTHKLPKTSDDFGNSSSSLEQILLEEK